uniref:Uncharacterized protein n=1 Tax=Candidatus Kentrum sp. TUN TaxID=2126343 RepID=A0A451A3W4_9GAMM|nr:MAG: hypothetical protein BECKTUN1418F_GA0071002_11016 [Candidatus Kentron sp. TUN]VFK60711.1 MAG: hypothetical protein BECKTUN1418D_GA0071000_11332 [Candidatus Kentron sp. TUN]VFK64719.1 MAG: hypothetical protein BECKTUN1418E_GA0071001_10987 [Candidatus Kentron sp. TUN]
MNEFITENMVTYQHVPAKLHAACTFQRIGKIKIPEDPVHEQKPTPCQPILGFLSGKALNRISLKPSGIFSLN